MADFENSEMLEFDSYEEMESDIDSLRAWRDYWGMSQQKASQALDMSLSGYRKAERRKHTSRRDLMAAWYVTVRWQLVMQAEREANHTDHLPHYPRADD